MQELKDKLQNLKILLKTIKNESSPINDEEDYNACWSYALNDMDEIINDATFYAEQYENVVNKINDN